MREFEQTVSTALAKVGFEGGAGAPPAELGEAEEIADLALEILVERLQDAAARGDTGLAAELAGLGVTLHRLLRELQAHSHSERLDALANVHDGLSRLRGAATMEDVIGQAGSEVCRSCGFDETIVLRVEGNALSFASQHPDVDAPAPVRELFTKGPLDLRAEHLESEVVRQRAAVLVTDPVTDPRVGSPLTAALGHWPFVIAPLVVEQDVIGLVVANCRDSGRMLARLDRDALWAFADGLGYVLERAALTQRLQAHRAHVRELIRATEAATDELCEAEVRLARVNAESDPLPPATAALLGPRHDTRGWALSAREVEVLEAMASGATNAEIGARLFISEDTVKTHVKRILRKLGAANRVDAVSRFLRGTG